MFVIITNTFIESFLTSCLVCYYLLHNATPMLQNKQGEDMKKIIVGFSVFLMTAVAFGKVTYAPQNSLMAQK